MCLNEVWLICILNRDKDIAIELLSAEKLRKLKRERNRITEQKHSAAVQVCSRELLFMCYSSPLTAALHTAVIKALRNGELHNSDSSTLACKRGN